LQVSHRPVQPIRVWLKLADHSHHECRDPGGQSTSVHWHDTERMFSCSQRTNEALIRTAARGGAGSLFSLQSLQ
jgi:hypothetical protein